MSSAEMEDFRRLALKEVREALVGVVAESLDRVGVRLCDDADGDERLKGNGRRRLRDLGRVQVGALGMGGCDNSCWVVGLER
jgi:hypothetical protein